MADSITIVSKSDCCGCKACGDICPTRSISYVKDLEGFLYPLVQDTCVKCGICTKICPALNRLGTGPDVEQSFKACFDKNKDRRDTGSSGGIFGLMASYLMSEGWSVCGAAFDDNLQLKHSFASSEMEVGPLKKSKYLQSDTTGVYSSIKTKLGLGEKVMFVGTPCQCNALKNYLRNDYPGHLLVVDFACHGVPSQDLFDKCIDYYEQKNLCKVISYQFRHKPQRYGSPQNFKLIVQIDNAIKTVEGKYYDEPFYYGFQKYMTLRPSCYQCHWASTARVSDITLADFWGIESVTSRWDRRDYPSLVILNSEYGKLFFEKIAEDLVCIETSREQAIKSNSSLVGPTVCPTERDAFFKDIQTDSFELVVKKHLSLNRRILKEFYYTIPFGIRKIALRIFGKL